MAAAGFRIAALALLSAACTSIAADSGTFANTRWHVTAIDGRATPSTANYLVRFDKNQIGGQFGCNHFGGEYRVTGNMLVATAIRSTMMACMEPAASFEAQGFAVLNHPMRMNWSSSQRLTLGNAAGSVDLQRIP